jgi:CHAT domain-containing protein
VYHVAGENPTAPVRPEGAILSWVFVLTRDGVEFFPVPETQVLDTQVPLYIGRLEKRAGSAEAAGELLSEEILGEALDSLPERIRSLVIVSEGPLARLNFATLPTRDGRPLIERYEISYTPSATLWVRWKQAESLRSGEDYLAFADPDLPALEVESGERAADPWLEGLRLGRLPHARREVSGVIRQLGKGRALVGEEASEDRLKRADLARTGILHFATHAVFDEELPHRSSLVLAAGGGDQDGLLQFREIVDLNLRDCTVFLNGCRSARGEVLKGEGALSLAHAFFRSGARAVIASVWPLRDDETADLMAALSRRLARGASVAEALNGAQREMIASERDPAAWGGLLVLGDGDFVPVPGGRRPHAPVVALVVIVVVAGAWLLLRRGRSSSAPKDSNSSAI